MTTAANAIGTCLPTPCIPKTADCRLPPIVTDTEIGLTHIRIRVSVSGLEQQFSFAKNYSIVCCLKINADRGISRIKGSFLGLSMQICSILSAYSPALHLYLYARALLCFAGFIINRHLERQGECAYEVIPSRIERFENVPIRRCSSQTISGVDSARTEKSKFKSKNNTLPLVERTVETSELTQ